MAYQGCAPGERGDRGAAASQSGRTRARPAPRAVVPRAAARAPVARAPPGAPPPGRAGRLRGRERASEGEAHLGGHRAREDERSAPTANATATAATAARASAARPLHAADVPEPPRTRARWRSHPSPSRGPPRARRAGRTGCARLHHTITAMNAALMPSARRGRKGTSRCARCRTRASALPPRRREQRAGLRGGPCAGRSCRRTRRRSASRRPSVGTAQPAWDKQDHAIERDAQARHRDKAPVPAPSMGSVPPRALPWAAIMG